MLYSNVHKKCFIFVILFCYCWCVQSGLEGKTLSIKNIRNTIHWESVPEDVSYTCGTRRCKVEQTQSDGDIAAVVLGFSLKSRGQFHSYSTLTMQSFPLRSDGKKPDLVLFGYFEEDEMMIRGSTRGIQWWMNNVTFNQVSRVVTNSLNTLVFNLDADLTHETPRNVSRWSEYYNWVDDLAYSEYHGQRVVFVNCEGLPNSLAVKRPDENCESFPRYRDQERQRLFCVSTHGNSSSYVRSAWMHPEWPTESKFTKEVFALRGGPSEITRPTTIKITRKDKPIVLIFSSDLPIFKLDYNEDVTLDAVYLPEDGNARHLEFPSHERSPSSKIITTSMQRMPNWLVAPYLDFVRDLTGERLFGFLDLSRTISRVQIKGTRALCPSTLLAVILAPTLSFVVLMVVMYFVVLNVYMNCKRKPGEKRACYLLYCPCLPDNEEKNEDSMTGTIFDQ